MNARTDPEGHYPQNTISHCIILIKNHITMHFFQGRISAMPEMTAGLFLAISKTGMCLLISSCLNILLFLVPSWQRFQKSWFKDFFFKSKLKFRMILSKLVVKTLIL